MAQKKEANDRWQRRIFVAIGGLGKCLLAQDVLEGCPRQIDSAPSALIQKPTDRQIAVTRIATFRQLANMRNAGIILGSGCIVSILVITVAISFDHTLQTMSTVMSLRISAMGGLVLVGVAGLATVSGLSRLDYQTPNVRFSVGESASMWPTIFCALQPKARTRRTMFMNASVGELLSNHMHISGAILEDYVLGLLDQTTERAVKKHIRVCDRCRQEIDAALATMRRSLAVKPAMVEASQAETSTVSAETEPEFNWKGGATLWLNDASYTLVPVEDNPLLARVELLTLWQLLDRINEDTKSPGTYLASIETRDNIMTFPLAKCREVLMAVAAAGTVGYEYQQQDLSSQRDCVNRRVLQCTVDKYTVDVFADSGDNVYLSTRLSPQC